MAKNFSIREEGAFQSTQRLAINRGAMPDIGYVSTQMDVASNTTLANVSGMVTTLLQPGTYIVNVNLDGVSTTNGGMKVAFKQGTANMLSALQITAIGRTASAMALSRVTSTTDQASLFASNAAATINLTLTGTLTVATEGTLTLQFAQNASSVDTSSIYAGSFMTFVRIS